MSKKFALRIIDSLGEYSHFSSAVFSYPSYFDEDTIKRINSAYDGKFDAHILYDVEEGSVIYNMDQTNTPDTYYQIMNEAFTKVYKNKDTDDLNKVIIESLGFAETKIKDSLGMR